MKGNCCDCKHKSYNECILFNELIEDNGSCFMYNGDGEECD